MNAELAGLLRDVGIDAHQAIMLQNGGPIPPPPGSGRDRGFKLVVIDRQGIPTHFCRCASAAIPGLAREADIMTRLRTDARLADFLSPVLTTANDRIRLLVTPFAPRGDCIRAISALPLEAWGARARQVLAQAGWLSERAPALVPSLAAPSGLVSVAAAAEPHLERLAAVLPAPAIEVIQRAMAAAAPAPRTVQHGDLWAGNLLDLPQGWRLVDFEIFGEVDVPLYDACQLLRTSLDNRLRSSGTWLEAMRGSGGEVVLVRELLREAANRHGLDASQRLAACLYYVVDFASRVALRGARPVHFRFFHEVDAFASALTRGEDLQAVLFGGGPSASPAMARASTTATPEPSDVRYSRSRA